MRSGIAILLCAIMIFALTNLPAYSSGESDLAPDDAIKGDYVLAPDDVIEINIWGEPDLSKRQIQINKEGNITVPFVNSIIKAAGLTQQELAFKIADEYTNADILIDPKVDVNVVVRHRKKVWVSGQVQKPGVVFFQEGDTIASAIAEAGSYTPQARLEAAELTRRGIEKPIPIDLKKLYMNGDLTQNYVLQDGDQIHIPEDNFNRYYVLGEVMKPGLYFLRDNATVLSAVMQAGGPTPRGTMKGVTLVRGDVNEAEKWTVDLNKIAQGDLTQDVALEPGDVIYVSETSKPDWGKISQILNAITSLGVIRRYGIF